VEIPYDSVLVRYGEIALKGPIVRRSFEERLCANISDCLENAGIEHGIERRRGRILLKTPESKEASKSLSKVFGIVSTSPAITTGSSVEDILASSLDLARCRILTGTKFAVDTNRGDKSFSLTSQEINSRVGEAIRVETGARVDLDSPEVKIGIDIREKTYIFDQIIPGPGGLPLGTAGRIISLFSGGIDSPVGAYLMMKRGCESHLLYMDNSPYVEEGTTVRAIRVAEILQRYSSGFDMNLLVVPYGHVLKKIIDRCPRRLTCILCKRTMTRIAGAVARKEGCDAVMNGSSLAQVCSQTMTNLSLTLSVGDVPALMPLVGLDKEEIVNIARRIGTYEASSSRTMGCTAVPRYPKTSPTLKEIEDAESQLDIEELVAESLEGIRRMPLGRDR
jgi:thiamine biosynthesis protein ThiI